MANMADLVHRRWKCVQFKVIFNILVFKRNVRLATEILYILAT